MKRIGFLLTALLVSAMAFAQGLSLPTILGNRMVLQRNADACIWGRAEEGATVKVKTSWSKTAYTATADVFGEWKVYVKTGDAATGESIKISSNGETVQLKDVMIGDVWLCSGQSNMQFKVGASLDVSELAKTPNPNIRLYNSGRISANIPQEDIPDVSWTETSPAQVKEFSAVGYAFGDMLQKELDVPIGLVCVSFGGTPVEAWTPEECLTDPKWIAGNKALLANPKNEKKISRLATATEYNANIAPIVNMTVSGVIWYQGCHNVSYSAPWYGEMLENMINSWRNKFNAPQMPFYIVQIVPQLPYEGINGALVREGQAAVAAKMDHVEVIGTIDQMDRPGDIHPRYKMEVARRLANAALGEHYGKDVAYRMPCYSSMEVEGSTVRVHFDNVTGNLVCAAPSVIGFQLAGDDNKYRPAKAVIDGKDVILSAKKVENPVNVRYCFNEYTGEVKDENGLPLLPFRTDRFDNVQSAIDHIGTEPSGIAITVKGADFNNVEKQVYDLGAKPWTNRDLTLPVVIPEFRGFEFLPATWKGVGEQMNKLTITALEDGTIYLLSRNLSYFFNLEKDGWKTFAASKAPFVNAKKQVKGQLFISYKDVKAGESVVLPASDANLNGVCPLAKSILTEKEAVKAKSAPAAQKDENVFNRYGMNLEKTANGWQPTETFRKLLSGRSPEGVNEPCQPSPAVPSKFIADVETAEIIYKNEGGRPLKLLINKAAAANAPVMLYIHGGGWRAGAPDSMLKYSKYLAKYKGVTGVCVQYSMAGADGVDIETSIQDCLDAVRYVKDHAAELGVDVSRIGVLGHSAGGHLAACVALKDTDVKLLAGWAGVYDLSKARIVGESFRNMKIYKSYFRNFDASLLKSASPVNMVTGGRSLKILLYSGGCDALVEPSQAKALRDKLISAGYEVEDAFYELYGHNIHNRSDKGSEFFQRCVDFISNNI